MTYEGPCGCKVSDEAYTQAQKGRINIEHGPAVTSWPTCICPSCGKKTNNMWWDHV
jgi:hypothetical protein